MAFMRVPCVLRATAALVALIPASAISAQAQDGRHVLILVNTADASAERSARSTRGLP
jgi:hypothetical protein